MSRIRLCLFALTSFLSLACTDSSGNEGSCQAGQFWCECFNGSLCANGSSCLDGTCVPDGNAEGETSNPGDGDGDDPGGCDPACPEGSICENGECVALGTCPCPSGSYCNLATNTCVEGCLSESDCPDGSYCDVVNKQCNLGCIADEDCPGGQYCDLALHACTDPCAGCEDDGNPCTYESCASGSCEKGDLEYGEACPGSDDGNECTVRACDGNGACTHVPVNQGVSCTSPNVCSTSACNGQGTCVTAGPVSGPSCGANPYEEICLDGQCTDVFLVCVDGDEMFGHQTNPWDGEEMYECYCEDGYFYHRTNSLWSVTEETCGECLSFPLLNIDVCTL